MRGLLPRLESWWRRSRPFALATLVDAVGSTPLPAGTAMAVDGEGEMLGAISGGCVDADVASIAEEVLRDGRPVLRRYGPAGSGGGLFDVGLTCGGTVTVWVEPVHGGSASWLPALAAAVREGRPVALATRLDGATPGHLVVLPDGGGQGSVGDLDDSATTAARRLLPAGGTRLLRVTGPAGDAPGVFVAAHASPPLLAIVSWTPVARPLARIGGELGYRPMVLERRPAFAAQARDADVEVMAGPPEKALRTLRTEGTLDGRSAVVVVLTHDAHVDVPVLLEARAAGAGYLGAMGSAATHRDRSRRLRAAGCGEPALAAVHSPIGLALGGRTPAEVATAIAAELVAVRNGRSMRTG
nr:XdhC family protein [Streptomyces sp. NBC_00830]